MNEFIKLEYEQCLALVKYYDERYQALVQYSTGLSSAIPSFLLAIFQLGNGANKYFWDFSCIISFITALGLLTLFTVLVQIRLYFIYPVRQVNSIRKFALDNYANSTFVNQMYLTTNVNAFKLLSSQTLLSMFVTLQIGIFFGLGFFSLYIDATSKNSLITSSLILGISISMLCFAISSYYLDKKSKYHPDISIHHQ